MTELLVELNQTRIDGEDMAVVLRLLGDLAHEVEPAQQRGNEHGDNWVLYIHWMSSAPVPAALATGLPLAAVRIRDYFTGRGKLPPMRVELLDADRAPLMRISP
ncbi:hypothetical protein P3T36_000218 [Kitasatospora sp. MAP12-15]|uniref:hypothetical protein n=1 Tax=unclassified Kitasatospora TaxID=2633591 RepID=UPI002474DFB3|nr:hypothetical protein [Kitasatospora sp. MAP12-44]MDH6109447.1 hypothetical protein [Kitasatospora sp. MAP12-44]